MTLQSTDRTKSLSATRHDDSWIQVRNESLQPRQTRALLCGSDRELARARGGQTENGICYHNVAGVQADVRKQRKHETPAGVGGFIACDAPLTRIMGIRTVRRLKDEDETLASRGLLVEQGSSASSIRASIEQALVMADTAPGGVFAIFPQDLERLATQLD